MVYSPLPITISGHFTRYRSRASFCPQELCGPLDHDDDGLVWGAIELHLDELWQSFRLYFPGPGPALLRLLPTASLLAGLSVLHGAMAAAKIGRWVRQARQWRRRCALCAAAPLAPLVPVVAPALVLIFFGASVSLGVLLGLLFAAVSPCISASLLLVVAHQLVKDLRARIRKWWQQRRDRRHHRRNLTEEDGQGMITVGRGTDSSKGDDGKEPV